MAMNRENTEKTIALMKQAVKNEVAGLGERVQFDMNYYAAKEDCGYAGCLAGFAAIAAGKSGLFVKAAESKCMDDVSKTGKEFLGLREDQARELFSPGSGGYSSESRAAKVESPWDMEDSPYTATVEQGIAALQRALELYGEKEGVE